MKLRRLTDMGIAQFEAYISQLRSDQRLAPPLWLLEDETFSQSVADTAVEDRAFANRLDAAIRIDGILASSELSNVDRDLGLWTWLTLFYFNQACPPRAGGARKVGAAPTYVPSLEQRRFYRHVFLGPWLLLRSHRDDPSRLAALLCSPVNVTTSETFRLFIENPSLVGCAPAVSVATRLYYDTVRKKLKRGAGSKDQNRGECRRLISFLQQLDCTYDIASMTEDSLISLLPKEFKSFIPTQRPLELS